MSHFILLTKTSGSTQGYFLPTAAQNRNKGNSFIFVFKGVGGGVWPKKIKISHLNIFSYLDYGEANAFYGIEKKYSGAEI